MSDVAQRLGVAREDKKLHRRPRRSRDEEREPIVSRIIRAEEDGDAIECYATDTRYERAVKEQQRRRAGRRGRPLTRDEEHLAHMLDTLALLRQQAAETAADIKRYVSRREVLQKAYDRFLAIGGIDGDDFTAMIHDGLDPKPVAHRGALRLVHSRKPIKRVMLEKAVKPFVKPSAKP